MINVWDVIIVEIILIKGKLEGIIDIGKEVRKGIRNFSISVMKEILVISVIFRMIGRRGLMIKMMISKILGVKGMRGIRGVVCDYIYFVVVLV